ncbi:MAG TPA: PEPxxWA-CTERM sorting domain-containing protein [Sphingomonas sp.]|jgi:hypothetical protein
MKKLIGVAMLGASMIGMASYGQAAIVTRSFNVTANQFSNFSGQPAPFSSFGVDFSITYDNSKSGFFGAPDSFRVVTDGQVNAGAFSATPIAGYFAPQGGMFTTARIGLGGAINGGNTSLNGTNDFYITFNVDPVAFGSVSFTTPQAGAFLSAGALVRETTAIAAVPEPQTWMLLLAGFGAVGVTIRRNRPRTALA